jgi:DNA polymerase-3 subunit epsilon
MTIVRNKAVITLFNIILMGSLISISDSFGSKPIGSQHLGSHIARQARTVIRVIPKKPLPATQTVFAATCVEKVMSCYPKEPIPEAPLVTPSILLSQHLSISHHDTRVDAELMEISPPLSSDPSISQQATLVDDVLREIPPPPILPTKPIRKLAETIKKTDTRTKGTPPPTITLKPVDTLTLDAICRLSMHLGSKTDFNQLFNEYIVIDTEATGLGNDHEMTEIGAVKMRNMQPTGEKFHMYLNPGREVSPSAHRLTQHTWKALKRFPSFKDIASQFLAFIGELPLVFHNAHFDLKLINKGIKDIVPYKLEDRHVIIDTYLLAKSMNPGEKNGLTSLAQRYDLKRPGNSDVHGALIDADLLCDVFRGLFGTTGFQFHQSTAWEKLKPVSVDSFSHIKNTAGELFFRKLGMRGALPTTFKYSYNLYHPKLHQNFPAILIPLSTPTQENAGFYIRYIIDSPLELSQSTLSLAQTSRAFYGSITPSPMMHLYGNPDATTLILGSLTACLFFRDQLELKNDTSEYIGASLGSSITVNAYLDPAFLGALEVPDNIHTIVVLSENDPLGTELHKNAYYELMNKFCLPQFLPFSKVRETKTLFAGWLVKLNNETWVIDSQEETDTNIVLNLIDTRYKKRKARVVINEHEIFVDDTLPIPLNSSDMLLSPPLKKLILIPLRCTGDGDAPLNKLLRKNPGHILERLKLRLHISQPKGLGFYEKVVLAHKLYGDALAISEGTPSAKYFKKRGINATLPESFRHLQSMFHPGQDKNFPLTLVPLADAEGRTVAVHRLFCDEDGNQLQKKSGYPSKLSLGKAAGASVELYNHTFAGIKPDMLMISEGIENALVVREALINKRCSNPNEVDQLLRKLDSTSGITIQAVVGVNGLIDAPIDNSISKVLLLADNDGYNRDVKSTIIKTVEHYLLSGKRVKIALPYTEEQSKTDFNDIYLSTSMSKRDDAILTILSRSIDINSAAQLGSEEESLETSLRKLNASAFAPKKPIDRISIPKDRASTIEHQLKDLVSDKMFIAADYKRRRGW